MYYQNIGQKADGRPDQCFLQAVLGQDCSDKSLMSPVSVSLGTFHAGNDTLEKGASYGRAQLLIKMDKWDGVEGLAYISTFLTFTRKTCIRPRHPAKLLFVTNH